MAIKKVKIITIGVFGYGNMGKAIVEQLRNVSLHKSIVVHSLGETRIRGVRCVQSLQDLLEISNILFLCIKPQDFYQLKQFSSSICKHLTIISIMAGIRITHIEKIFPGAKVIRTMPNLPLQVGQGVTGWYCKEGSISPVKRALVKRLLSTFGLSIKLSGEHMLDAVTAVSGSGPAYVFLFANALTKAAVQLGFSQSEAKDIISQTISGSLAYISSLEKVDFNNLIGKVKSKGGTTEAALASLDEEHFYQEWQKAVEQAYKRAQEISSHEFK